ncbi:MAG: 3-hydroxyacyl-CoA dehydrogenase family protein [Clostridiaceae bacterium]
MREIKKVGVAGSGTMGSGIAMILAQNGYDVVLGDIDPKFLEVGKRIIALNQENLMKEGLLTQDLADATLGRMSFSVDKADYKDCDLVIECIVEKLEIKKVFWKEVEAIVSPECILASNTSGLSINAMSEDVALKSRFIGMHWWNPPHIIPLIELIKGYETSEDTVETLQDLIKKIGKESVVVLKDKNGFIGNRLQFAVLREAIKIVEDGIATVEDVDKAMKFGPGFRYPSIGPFETADLGGLDTFYYITTYLNKELADTTDTQELLKSKMDSGQLGVKSGKGFYDYSDGKDKETIAKRDKNFYKQLRMLKGEK